MSNRLEQAIARMEGFGAVSTNRPTRNNNPGDLEYRPWQTKFGATMEVPLPHQTARFAKFPTVEQGYAALGMLLLEVYGEKTVQQLIAIYAPPSENNTNAYVTGICAACACASSTLVKDLL